MVIKQVTLEAVCGFKSQLPKTDKPEIAFAGKSNVGKSSLINTLVNRKSLARTSSQPGKTQTINYYNVNDELYLTDLPGYGFAKAPESEKRRWGALIEKYLNGSEQLRAVFLLIDIRHDPSGNDRMMYEWMAYQGFHPIIIATKADKIKRSQLQKQLKAIRTGLNVQPDTVMIPFSAVTRQGRDEIWDLMEQLCRGSDRDEERPGAKSQERPGAKSPERPGVKSQERPGVKSSVQPGAKEKGKSSEE